MRLICTELNTFGYFANVEWNGCPRSRFERTSSKNDFTDGLSKSSIKILTACSRLVPICSISVRYRKRKIWSVIVTRPLNNVLRSSFARSTSFTLIGFKPREVRNCSTSETCCASSSLSTILPSGCDAM